MTTCIDYVTRYRVLHPDGKTYTMINFRTLKGAMRAQKRRGLEGALEKSTDCCTWQKAGPGNTGAESWNTGVRDWGKQENREMSVGG
jgi:hypothetical protein